MYDNDILLLENSPSLVQIYTELLKDEPLNIKHLNHFDEVLPAIASSSAKLLIMDVSMPSLNILQAMGTISGKGVKVILSYDQSQGDNLTRYIQPDCAVFLAKPFSAQGLISAIRQVMPANVSEMSGFSAAVSQQHSQQQLLQHPLVQQQANALFSDLASKPPDHSTQYLVKRKKFHGFIGSSTAMQSIYQTIEQVAPSNAPVFISGDSGTGKEVCAQTIHQCSDRAKQPFVALNCAAIPHELVESEIFGHIKGAFTGAVKDRVGAAMQANGGTLFLDEIAEMDIELQAKLLRFIQTQSFQRVGDSRSQKVDIRFICATNRHVQSEVEKGRFREDLYYRLNVINLHLPPLRKRGNDVVEIAQAFLQRFAKEEGKTIAAFSKATQNALLMHRWQGNVRELQNAIRRAVVLCRGDEISLDLLGIHPPSIKQTSQQKSAEPVVYLKRYGEQHKPVVDIGSSPEKKPIIPTTIKTLHEVERESIQQAIAVCDGNIPKAAVMLDVSPSTLYRKLQAWERTADQLKIEKTQVAPQ